MATKRILIASLALLFTIVIYGHGKDAIADHVENPMAAVGWENTTKYVEEDFGIKFPFNTPRWSVHCVRHQSGGARTDLRNILRENVSMPLCYAEDMRSGYAHIALYAEHTRVLKEREQWQKNIATPFLNKLGKDALSDMRQYVSLYMGQFTIREEFIRIDSEEAFCDNARRDLKLRQYTLVAENSGAMNVSDISFSMSHSMYVMFMSFLTPNEDVYITLIVYNRGTSHDIKNDACALARQMRF